MATKLENPPLTKQDLKFCTFWRQYRGTKGIYQAAERAGIPKTRALKTFERQDIQDEIERQDEAVRMERAKQEVVVEKLHGDLIDRELVKVIMLDEKTHGGTKLEGIRLGLVALGRIQAGNTRSLTGKGDDGDDLGSRGVVNCYQAIVRVNSDAEEILPGGHGTWNSDQGSEKPTAMGSVQESIVEQNDEKYTNGTNVTKVEPAATQPKAKSSSAKGRTVFKIG